QTRQLRSHEIRTVMAAGLKIQDYAMLCLHRRYFVAIFQRDFGCAVMALGILTSCTAQTTTAFRPSNQSTTTLPTSVSEIRNRNNFRDEQQAAPRVNNAPIDP